MNNAVRPLVLLVENDAALADELARNLAAHGYRVETFPDYRGALAMLESERDISLMVTALRLPQGTPHGIALANMAVQKRPGLPVVFIACDAEAAQWIDGQWPHVLLKPVDGAQLVATIERVLRG
ncbi:MAG: response regulator [Hyphomicrobiales bacterium]|nr:response regulator [Hyphomicrobiales bacterium]